MNEQSCPKIELWKPSASLQALKHRAAIVAGIRDFFQQRQVLEVDTPAMSQACVTDVHLHSFRTELIGPAAPYGQTLYLQTSPEFHMKRLLAAGSGPIYQLCKSFRNEEAGRIHNPEFTMLEWYRPDFDHFKLMTEVDELLQLVLGRAKAEWLTYAQAFERHLGIDPLGATHEQLVAIAQPLGVEDLVNNESSRDTQLQLLFALGVEPHIGQDVPCFVYHFPASQAALARISAVDPLVAERFEVYYHGVELANGFHELSDAKEQLRRFKIDNVKRREAGLPESPIDERLIEALKHGLPDCAGVALGVDRLVMLALGQADLKSVCAFDVGRA
jgi:lysyl-tRNA synthetase class 2